MWDQIGLWWYMGDKAHDTRTLGNSTKYVSATVLDERRHKVSIYIQASTSGYDSDSNNKSNKVQKKE
jgi:hypothetical protein